jgi:hypothetical protein
MVFSNGQLRGRIYYSNMCSLTNRLQVVKLRFQDSPNEPSVKNINIAALMPSAGVDIDRISSYNTPGTVIQVTGGILRFPTHTFKKLFQPSLDHITDHIKHLLANDACISVKHLFLVGGYAESPVLVNAIKASVGNRVKVVCPPRPGSAVMIGAVQYGLNPECISSRVAVRTIGVEMSEAWDESLHAGRNSFIDEDGEKLCTDAVTTFITAGSHIDTSVSVQHFFLPVARKQRSLCFTVIASEKKEMPFSTDPGVSKIGTLSFPFPRETMALPKQRRGIALAMKFGGTVFTATATCVNTGQVLSANFMFPLGTLQKLYHVLATNFYIYFILFYLFCRK